MTIIDLVHTLSCCHKVDDGNRLGTLSCCYKVDDDNRLGTYIKLLSQG